MRAVVQRVSRASVTVAGRVTGSIGRGLLVLAGFAPSDGAAQVEWMADKVAGLRVFGDEAGKMNRSVSDVGGGILLVSQFTLYGDATGGNRPSFTDAAPPTAAEPLYEEMVRRFRATAGIPVETGSFGAEMEVRLVNDGPVTILLEK